jgi:hypothetical protein
MERRPNGRTEVEVEVEEFDLMEEGPQLFQRLPIASGKRKEKRHGQLSNT